MKWRWSGAAWAAIICFLALTVQPGHLASAQKMEGLRPDHPLEAAWFRYQQRLSENGKIPDNALMLAKAQRDALLGHAQFGPMAVNGAYPGGWAWLGPGNIGGRIRAIVVHPTNPSTMWIGSASGGIWKTTVGGSQWFPLDDFMPTLSVGCMAIDPSNPNILYAGTGEGFFETLEGSSNTAAVRGAGIFKSSDGGATWDQIPSTSSSDWYFVNRIALAPGSPQTILAATNSGLYRSTNGGTTWALVSAGVTYDVKFHPTDSMKAIAGLHDSGAKYTLDGGQTWTAATGIAAHRTELCYASSSPSTIYATVSDNDAIKIYRSTNGGQSYALRTTGSGVGTYSAYNNTLWVDPTNVNRIIFGGVNLYRSTDGGATQTQTFGGVHSDMHAIVTHPAYDGVNNRTVFFGTDGGIYRTTDTTGSSSGPLNNNVGITQFYGAKMNPISGRIIAGAQDNGTKLYTGNAQGWTTVAGGDGGYCDTDPTDQNFMYGETQWAFVFRSTTAGASAAYIYNGPNPIVGAGTTDFNFIPYLTLDPNDPNRMYVGGKLLWRSNNVKAATVDWSHVKDMIAPPGNSGLQLGGPEAHFLPNPPYNISTIAVAQGNSNLVWVGYNNGQVWKTTNGLNAAPTWQRVDQGILPGRWVSKIVIAPLDSNQVYVSFMGWEPDNLWKTSNGGANWTGIAGTAPFHIPSAPVSALAVHPTKPGWLYAGTDIGLFFSADDGATWSTSNQGPGIVPIEELHWMSPTRLFAVTHGRGVYQATLNLPAIAFSPESVQVVMGDYISGRLSDLYASDDRYYRAQVSPQASRGVIHLEATSPLSNPAVLRITGETSTNAGATEQAVALFVFLYKPGVGFEMVSTAKVSGTDNPWTITLNGTLAAQYVDPSTRKIQMRVIWNSTNGEQKTLSIDQVVFEVEGG